MTFGPNNEFSNKYRRLGIKSSVIIHEVLMWLAAGYCRSTLSHARNWWLHLEDLIILVFHRREKISMIDTWKMLTLLTHSYVGGAMLCNHLKYSEIVWIGTRVPILLNAVFDVSLGIREGFLDLRLPHNPPEKGNTTASFGSPGATTSSVFKKSMGRMKFSRLFRYWPHDSSFLARL